MTWRQQVGDAHEVRTTDTAALVEQLAERVATIMDLPSHRVPRRSPIRALGIDSLKAVELITLIEDDYGVLIPVEKLLEDISLLDLARIIQGRDHEEAASRPGARAWEGRWPAFSLFYFASDSGESGLSYELFLKSAQFADENLFQAIWIPERHFNKFGGIFPNPSVLGAAVAVLTRRIRIRAGSVVLPLHHPVRVAEEWSVVDNLSHGRVDLAFARGWNPNDFVLAPQKYRDSADQFAADVATVKELWRGDPVGFENGLSERTTIRIFPPPAQADVEIWLTCTNEIERFRQAGALGYNVLTGLLFHDLETLTPKLEAYRQARAVHGHDPSGGKVTLMVHTHLGDDRASVLRRVEDPLKRYLRSSIALWKDRSAELRALSSRGEAAVIDYAFHRYVNMSALIGTAEQCRPLVAKIARLGIDEVACLVDFGVEPDFVLEGLRYLSELKLPATIGADGQPAGDGKQEPSALGACDHDS